MAGPALYSASPWKEPIPKSTESGFILELEDALTVANARQHRSLLLNALQQPAPITIDLHRVTMIDMAGVQLLLAMQRSADAAKRVLHFTGIDGRVAEVLDLLRLRSCIG